MPLGNPGSMPSWGSAPDYSGMLQQSMGELAPLATSYHGAQTGVAINQIGNKVNTAQPSNLSKFGHFLGGVASSIGHIGEGVVSWLGKFALNTVEAPEKYGADLAHGILEHMTLSSINTQNQQQSARLQNLVSQYKDGKISKDNYLRALDSLNQDMSNTSSQETALLHRLPSEQHQAVTDTIDTASTLVTVLTAGFGKAFGTAVTFKGLEPVAAKTTTDYLVSTNANAFLSTAEKAVARLATDPEAFAKLTPMAQKVIQNGVAEVLNQGEHMSAAQIARASVVNLALKYPIYFNYLSSTGNQIYQQLDQKKYGDAVRTIAFNATLLLSGGPIGAALKYGRGVVKGAVGGIFARTAFIDELSKGIGNGDPAGLFNAVSKITDPALKAEVIRGLSSVEATNMSAQGGDAVAAAWRVIKGMNNYEGISLNNFTHEEALNNMVNFSKAQQLASSAAKAARLGDVTVGRIDARQLAEVSAETAPFIARGDVAGATNALESLAQRRITYAWPNNENIMNQFKSLMVKHSGNEASYDTAIRNIKASFGVDGLPKAVSKQLSDMGYIPIKPVNLEAPFVEGTGKVASRFTKANDDFFLRTVQPLPVLGFMGDVFTRLGLSPNASTQQVYSLFNDYLSNNLQESKVISEIIGEDRQTTTDSLVKQLSDYAHDPTRGKIMSKIPITDLRMMTTKDIELATGRTASDARAIQNSISKAYMQIPLAIRGLGDRSLDTFYRFGPSAAIERRYLRIQGALRFSFNPFFQYLRVIPKTEILTQAEGGGFINSIFMGKAGQIEDIRSALRENGMFEERGHFGSVVSGEATDSGGITASNLTKKLLPMQERSIAGLVSAQADRMGVSWQTYVNEFPSQVRDTIQAIAQYDRRGNFINSPLARTLNVAVFPFRFETKVATIMVKSLARTPLMTQVAFINGLMKFNNWMNTPEGMAWYSHNQNVIKLFGYITPTTELNQVFSSLLPGHDHSLGNFGALGGLPFGWIPQLTDSMGLTHFNQPGVDATTGAALPSYVPATSKGQLAIAIQDFINNLFSYPGANLGLPSKSSLTRNIALGMTGANKKTDLKSVTPQLTKQQLTYQQAVQLSQQTTTPGLNINQQKPLIPSQSVPGLSVPAQDSSILHPIPKLSSSKTRTAKVKKGQRIPAMLPGQTQYGVLPS